VPQVVGDCELLFAHFGQHGSYKTLNSKL
jgi:hypothetical protein